MSTSNVASSESFILKNVRLDWHNLWTPGKPLDEALAADPSKWKYDATVIFDKGSANNELAKAAFIESAKKLWGDNAGVVCQAMEMKAKALRDGDLYLTAEGKLRENYIGKMYISAKNAAKPKVAATWKYKDSIVHIGEDGQGYIDGTVCHDVPFEIIKPYRGCHVDMKMHFLACKANPALRTSNMVIARLEAIRFVDHGEAFGAAAPSAEGFDFDEAPAMAVSDKATNDSFGL
jgi:Protein of unknown function (DUF2815)